MKRALSAIVGFALVGLCASPSYAGTKDPAPVNIVKNTDKTGLAQGSVGGARNSPDNVQAIGCDLSSSGDTPNLYCFAIDVAGTFANCVTNNVNLIDLAMGMTSDSYIGFRWNALGQCTQIFTRNESLLPPKLP
jgi:hypothetical protein